MKRILKSGRTLTTLVTIAMAMFGAVCEGQEESQRPVASGEVRGPVAGQKWRIDDLGLDLVWVAPGRFRMGSNDGHSDTKPVREVRISQGYWLGKYPVVQSEYEAIMGTNPSRFNGADLPVEQVSWNKAVEFCEKLTERERQAGRLPDGYVYRLPTEAEWEYAARGGNQSQGFDYAGSNKVDEVAWRSANSGTKTHPVGCKKANELGIHDMSGNVWEWVHDWYQNSYSGLGTTDPGGPGTGLFRVRRGGSWRAVMSSRCRVDYRDESTPSSTVDYLGFRVTLAPPVQ